MDNTKYRIYVFCEDGHSFFVYANSFSDVSCLVSCMHSYKINSIDITKVDAVSQEDNAGKEAENDTDR